MKTNTANILARLRLPGTAAPDNSSHDTPKVMQPPKPLRRILTGLAAALTLGLFSLPGVSRADLYLDGTVDWSTDHDQTTPFYIGIGPAQWQNPAWLGYATLNQTAGTVTTHSEFGIGYQFGTPAPGPSAYNMSGTAVFTNIGASNPAYIGRWSPSSTATWSLTDNASATVADLKVGAQGASDSHLLLSGAATFTASSVSFNDSSCYISFATGSTATLTVASENLVSYTTHVNNGNIRVDGVVQTDFTKFQVSGHTLSLSTGAPTPPQLVITSVSPASPTAGIGFSVTVETQDASNVPQNVTADTEVTLGTQDRHRYRHGGRNDDRHHLE